MSNTDVSTGETYNPSGWAVDDPSNAPPGSTTPGASALRSQSPLAQASGQYQGRMQALTADELKQYQGIEAAQAPFRAKLEQLLTSPNAAEAHLEKVKDQPKPEDYQKYSMEFAGAMAVMGALAGRFTRAGGTAALNAFSGAIKGWQQGNLQAYENASKEWEQATKKTIENNNIEIEKYKAVMADKKANIDQMMAAMNLVATQYQNKLMFDATAEKNYTMAFGAVDKMITANDRVSAGFDKLMGFRQDDKDSLKRQVDIYNKDPALALRIKEQNPQQWATLKGAAEQYGMTLNEPAEGTVPLAKPTSGTARSAPAMFMQRYMQLHPNASPEDIQSAGATYAGAVSRARTLGTRGANVDVAIDEAIGAGDQALQASAKVPRGEFVPITTIEQSIGRARSSPAQQVFDDANGAFITAYSQTMSRSGTNTVTAQNRAMHLLNTATGPEAYAAGVKQLQTEMRIVQQAVRDVSSGQTMDQNPATGSQQNSTDKSGWSIERM